MLELVGIVSDAIGIPVKIDWRDAQPGGVRATGGSIARAADLLGWVPRVAVTEGVRRQVAWHRDRQA
jgi:UDP-glucuronate 4-epimerase